MVNAWVCPSPAVFDKRRTGVRATIFTEARKSHIGLPLRKSTSLRTHNASRSGANISVIFCVSTQDDPLASKSPSFVDSLANWVLSSAFSVKPIADILKRQARSLVVKRAQKLGYDFEKEARALKRSDVYTRKAQLKNPCVKYPEYYKVDFHTYPNGNLSWEAAFEGGVAAVSVHATVFSPVEDPEGDRKLRQSYSDLLAKEISTPPRDVLDIGCSIGSSSFALQDLYPSATVTGLDLSPYFLAIAQIKAEERGTALNLVHGAAEQLPFPDQSFDLVSISLVTHELPNAPTVQMLQEAFRVLRPGGYLGIMDQNPNSEVFKRMKPFLKTLFRATEPYLEEYRQLDMENAIVKAGFTRPMFAENTPRHRTLIASRH